MKLLILIWCESFVIRHEPHRSEFAQLWVSSTEWSQFIAEKGCPSSSKLFKWVLQHISVAIEDYLGEKICWLALRSKTCANDWRLFVITVRQMAKTISVVSLSFMLHERYSCLCCLFKNILHQKSLMS